ncbi:hypothetical protein LINPERPRIM_LOCUS12812 [Linum perenne]
MDQLDKFMLWLSETICYLLAHR